MTRQMTDESGMDPNEAKFRATDPAPDEPDANDAEGHGAKIEFAKQPAPDEPDGNDADGHGIRAR